MASISSMNTITICYSTHRLETLELTARIMHEHDVIILEEPIHVDFSEVLKGNVEIEEHLLELDTGYPEFILDAVHCYIIQAHAFLDLEHWPRQRDRPYTHSKM